MIKLTGWDATSAGICLWLFTVGAHRHHGWHQAMCVRVNLWAHVGVRSDPRASHCFVISSFSGWSARLRLFSMCVGECDCIPLCDVRFHRHVRTVRVCVWWWPPHLFYSESHSFRPHQRVCGRQNDKAEKPGSACLLPHTYNIRSYLEVYHTHLGVCDTYCLTAALPRRMQEAQTLFFSI